MGYLYPGMTGTKSASLFCLVNLKKKNGEACKINVLS